MVEGQSMTTVADVVAQVRDGRLEDTVRARVHVPSTDIPRLLTRCGHLPRSRSAVGVLVATTFKTASHRWCLRASTA
jgi:hypothetical protein